MLRYVVIPLIVVAALDQYVTDGQYSNVAMQYIKFVSSNFQSGVTRTLWRGY